MSIKLKSDWYYELWQIILTAEPRRYHIFEREQETKQIVKHTKQGSVRMTHQQFVADLSFWSETFHLPYFLIYEKCETRCWEMLFSHPIERDFTGDHAQGDMVEEWKQEWKSQDFVTLTSSATPPQQSTDGIAMFEPSSTEVRLDSIQTPSLNQDYENLQSEFWKVVLENDELQVRNEDLEHKVEQLLKANLELKQHQQSIDDRIASLEYSTMHR